MIEMVKSDYHTAMVAYGQERRIEDANAKDGLSSWFKTTKWTLSFASLGSEYVGFF